MKIYAQIKQGTEEWHEHRLGKITGSEVYKYITPATYKMSSECINKNVYDLIGKERVDYDENDKAEFSSIPSYIAERGHAGEADVRFWYQEEYLESVTEVGFIESDCGNCGFSPDGIVTNGFIEIKTVNSAFLMKAKHQNSLQDYIHKESKGKYWLQILLGFYINPDFKFCDFILYCGSLKEMNERFFLERIERPTEELEKFSKGIADVIELKNKIKNELFNK